MASEFEDELDEAQVALRIAEADLARIRAAREHEYHNAENARDTHNGIYSFTDAVDERSVLACEQWLRRFSRRHPGEPIEIRLTSPGGSVYHGLALGMAIRDAQRHGHHITTVISGRAASMAGVIAQYGDHRVIGADSWLHIHEASSASWGKASEQVDSAEQTKQLTQQICQIYADRSGGKTDASEMLAWIERYERNLTAKEALERGFVDEIA